VLPLSKLGLLPRGSSVRTSWADGPLSLFMVATAHPPPKRKAGRPAMTWLTLNEVSAELGFDSAAPLARLLSFFPGCFPGAEENVEHGWIVPSTTLSALQRPRVGIELSQEATVKEVAEAIRRSPKTIWRWCQPGPGGEPAVLKSRTVADRLLIDVRSVMSLPARLPGWLSDAVKQSRMVTGGEKVSPKAARRGPRSGPDRQPTRRAAAQSTSRDSRCTE
jgi:hypothetical protein